MTKTVYIIPLVQNFFGEKFVAYGWSLKAEAPHMTGIQKVDWNGLYDNPTAAVEAAMATHPDITTVTIMDPRDFDEEAQVFGYGGESVFRLFVALPLDEFSERLALMGAASPEARAFCKALSVDAILKPTNTDADLKIFTFGTLPTALKPALQVNLDHIFFEIPVMVSYRSKERLTSEDVFSRVMPIASLKSIYPELRDVTFLR